MVTAVMVTLLIMVMVKGGHNKMPQSMWLMHWKFIFSPFWKLPRPRSRLLWVLPLVRAPF